jgi:hypothetical protein
VLGSDDMTAKLTGGGGAAADDDEDEDEVPIAESASEGEGSDGEEEDEEEEEAGGVEEGDSVSALENAWDCESFVAAVCLRPHLNSRLLRTHASPRRHQPSISPSFSVLLARSRHCPSYSFKKWRQHADAD